MSVHINNNKLLLNESVRRYAEHIFVLHGSLFLGNYTEIYAAISISHEMYKQMGNGEKKDVKEKCKC